MTAIGITKPGHRKRLKAEIARLNIRDGLPDFRPVCIYKKIKTKKFHDQVLNHNKLKTSREHTEQKFSHSLIQIQKLSPEMSSLFLKAYHKIK